MRFIYILRVLNLVRTKNKVLCPLVNVPMIDYTLEFLARNGVREVFIFCVSHANQLEEYLDSSKWGEHMEVRLRVFVRACGGISIASKSVLRMEEVGAAGATRNKAT